MNIKLEPDDFCGFTGDVSEKIKNSSDSSDLPQNVDKFGENVTGSNFRVTHLYK